MNMGPRIYSIAGPDGAGKTTLINQMAFYLEKNGKRPVQVWIRYNHYLSKFVLGISRVMRLTHIVRDEKGRVIHKHHRFHNHVVLKWMFVWSKTIDTVLATVIKVFFPILRRRNTIILCDRWIPDVITDIEVETGIKNIDRQVPVKWLISFVKYSHIIVLRAEEAELLTRRPENKYDPFLKKRIEVYERLMQSYHWIAVDSREPQQTFEETLTKTNLNIYHSNEMRDQNEYSPKFGEV
ncbi:MAG: hypothetical protein D6748_09640 [Calditrichaeota bacterium]|nr:MAG: hypothetical protein D6748_09640 [Calditrichota bacterium]